MTSPTASPSLAELAARARPDRNRAIDAYRAAAMLAVAGGHWIAIALGQAADGSLIAGNALQFAPQLSWLTWIFQVMPLFFVVGGYSSAVSLDAHAGRGGRKADWIAARLRRMVGPAVPLAALWLGVLAVGHLVGVGDLVSAAAWAASVPLWFLANYTIDTAIAPWVRPWFRRRPALVAAAGLAVFAGLESLRFVIPGDSAWHLVVHGNWVLGWFLFQLVGFAWFDGLLPTGARLAALAAAAWASAVALVTVGPYPTSMIHWSGLELGPTHPPSAALLAFGTAYSLTAVAAAPAVSRFFAGNARAWAAVVGANAIALSVYLWHMTAAVVAGALLYVVGALPTAEVGSAEWWVEKLPLIVLSLIALVGIVPVVAPVERKLLLAPRATWAGGAASIVAVAVAFSVAIKLWTAGDPATTAVCTAGVVALWFGALRDR